MPTVELPDLELIELTEEQVDEPCAEANCKTTAAWVCTCRTCGKPWPLCDKHYQYTNALVEMEYGRARCPACNAKAWHLVDVFIVVRLRVS